MALTAFESLRRASSVFLGTNTTMSASTPSTFIVPNVTVHSLVACITFTIYSRLSSTRDRYHGLVLHLVHELPALVYLYYEYVNATVLAVI